MGRDEDLISSILFVIILFVIFSYLYLFGVVWPNYSIVSYEVIILEYYADWVRTFSVCSGVVGREEEILKHVPGVLPYRFSRFVWPVFRAINILLPQSLF